MELKCPWRLRVMSSQNEDIDDGKEWFANIMWDRLPEDKKEELRDDAE